MTGPAGTPLDADERAIAGRLARLDGGAGPAPELDARVLAFAAGDGVVGARPAAGTRRPRARWAAGVGLAASVVLAAGLALQLRPPAQDDAGYADLPGAGAPPDAARTVSQAVIAAPSGAPDTAALSGSAGASEGAAQPVPEPAPQQSAARPAPVPAASAAAEAGTDTQASARNTMADAPAAAQAEPANSPQPPGMVAAPAPRAFPVPAPAAPPAAGSPVQEAKPAARTETATPEAAMAPSPQAGPARQDSAQRTQRAVPTSHPDEEAFDEAPPASADSPAVRRAWLARIRELVAAGESDAARASLQEFVRRHPAAVVPEDLRGLLP